MKLLFVIDSLGSGGAQRQLVTLAHGLSDRGHSPEFFVYYPQHDHFAPSLSAAGIPIHACPKRHRFSLAPPIALRKRMREGHYDVSLAYLETPGLYAELARLQLPTRLVVSERFMYPSGKLPFGQWTLQQFHRLADHITVNSHHQRERMERDFPWMRLKISTIYNGVDLGLFCPGSGSTAVPNAEPLTLLSIGTIVPKKNADGLMRAIQICRDEHRINVRVAWAGKTASSTYDSKLKARLSALHLEAQWDWLGERKDIPDLIHQYNAIIHPSFFEGLPNAICEGLASGRPILVSNVCDHARLVTDDVNGFLFNPAEPNSIANAVVAFHRLTANRRKEMGSASRRFAETHLAESRFVDDYEALFGRLANMTNDGRV